MRGIGALTLLSVMLLFIGGILVGKDYLVTGVMLTALGAGWNGILLATIQHISTDNKSWM